MNKIIKLQSQSNDRGTQAFTIINLSNLIKKQNKRNGEIDLTQVFESKAYVPWLEIKVHVVRKTMVGSGLKDLSGILALFAERES